MLFTGAGVSVVGEDHGILNSEPSHMGHVLARHVVTVACVASAVSLVRATDADPVPLARPPVAVPFELADVRLLDGPFRDAMVRDQDYLLSLEPDRFLSRFRTEAGLPPKAPRYGGWESLGVAGQTLGHYLSACSLMYASTGDGRFRDRATYIVDELALCQDHFNAGGYVGAIPDWKNAFGNLKARGGRMIGWVPWYTLHKEMAGLRDAHLYCGNAKAEQVLVRLADWVGTAVAPLDDRQMQVMLETEQGGMAETLADVYALTGRQKYMDLARRFTHHAVIDPLAAGADQLDGLHANTQVPKLIGAERIFTLTGDDYFGRAAGFFWQTVTERRTFATGGNGDAEHFFDPARAAQHLTAGTAETCNVYNMLKLSHALFATDPRPDYADYVERALYNQILGSQDPRRGMVTYHQSLRPGGFKVYSDPTNAMWCCVGTGMENHARYGESIYFHTPAAAAEPALWVNLFIPSQLTWAERGLTVRQETKYPDEPTTTLTITAEQPTELTLRLRVPDWLRGVPVLTVNGQPQVVRPTDGLVAVKRTWKTGDVITYTLPMEVRVEPLEGSPDEVAFAYGPCVLAADMGTEGLDKVQFYLRDENTYVNAPTPPAPVVVGSAGQLAAGVEPVPGEPLTFRTHGIMRPADLTLRPYSRTHYVRYAVYFHDYADPADYDRHAAAVAAAAEAERQLALRTVDDVRPGEQQSEVNHHLSASGSRTGTHLDRHWRDAPAGGSFEYAVRVPTDGPAELRCTYWGDDAGRQFDVLVDGQRVARESLTGAHPGEFFDAAYPLPVELTRGKSTVTVRFAPVGSSIAGGLFELRVLRPG
jgi:DUF1680 family protein